MSRTIFIGEPNEMARNALKCMNKVYSVAVENTKAGVKFIDVMKLLDKIYSEYNLIHQRVIGYAHSVGL